MNTQKTQQHGLDHTTNAVKSSEKESTIQHGAGNTIGPPRNGGGIVSSPGSDDEFLDAEQAALFLKIKLSTLYSKVEKGELPHFRSGKRKLLLSKQELIEYVVSRRGKTSRDISNAADNYIINK